MQGALAAFAVRAWCAVALAGLWVGACAAPVAHADLGDDALVLPENVAVRDGAVDLVVHMHGSQRRAAAAFLAAERSAVLLTVHRNGLSSVYREEFAAPQRWAELLEAARLRAAARLGLAELRWGRITVTAFSAGYGGVRELLRVPAHAQQIDAVVLADGLHAGYVDGRPNPAQMQPFVAFARRAVAGDKRLVISHSAIQPGSYASTTECADYLLDAVGLRRRPWEGIDPLGMERHSRADRGGFSVRGFAGTTAAAHTEHFRYLWAVLAE